MEQENNPELEAELANLESLLSEDRAALEVETHEDLQTSDIETPEVSEDEGHQESQEVVEEVSKEENTEEVEAEVEESKYAKLRKDKQRLARNWQELQAEKEAFRLEQEKIAAERKELEELRSKAKEPQYSPEEYEAVAEKFESEGEYDLAVAAKRKAAEVRAELKDAEARKGQQQIESYQKEWMANRDKVLEANPELKDPKSDLFKKANSVLEEHRDLLMSTPKGAQYAVDLAKLMLTSDKVGSLQKKVEALQAENNKLKKATSVTGSAPETLRKHQKSAGDMSAAEILKMCMEADGS